jgi:TatD DNase family protein
MELVDIGVNLAHRSFIKDRGAVVARALAAGVRQIVVTGTSVAGSREALALARAQPGVLSATAGVHPHDAARCDEGTLAALRELAAAPEVVAIGECGLDFNRDFSPRPLQRTWFERQVRLAIELGLPLFLHERDAAEAFLEVLDACGPAPEQVIVHCFTGDGATLQQYLRRGFYIGITGWICDERRGRHLQELVKQIPRERLLLETDAPFLAPRDIRPRVERNEPALLRHVAEVVARCRGEATGELAAATTANARRIFFKMAGSGPRP